jgi:hypothetical protein
MDSKDRDLQIDIMYQLEMATDLMRNVDQRLEMDGTDAYVIAITSLDEAIHRAAAALYMVQALGGGFRPENYDEILKRAANWDAWSETHDLISRVQRGHQMGGH